MEGDRSCPGFDEVVAAVVKVGFPLLPTNVGINITEIILILLPLHNYQLNNS